MKRALAVANSSAFLIAGIAVVVPDPVRFARNWTGATIYPWWVALYVIIGVICGLNSLLFQNRSWSPIWPTIVSVMAAQITGLGFVAVKHWEPSFGMGGGYAGDPGDLVGLAWVLGIAGAAAVATAVAQLVTLRVFPLRSSPTTALTCGGIGMLILFLLPYGIAEGDPGVQDWTSIGAFVLVYSGPIGATVAGAGLLPGRLGAIAVISCAVAAALSALGLITDLSHLHGRPALAGTALLLAAIAVWLWRKSLQEDLPREQRSARPAARA